MESEVLLGIAGGTRRFSWLRRHVLLCGALLVVLVLGLPTLIIPFSTDNAIFALGARTILSGHVLYRDFWEIKTPGIYFTYALAFIPFGEHMVSLRLLDIVNTLLATTAIYLLGRRYFGERAGIFAGSLYGIAYFTLAGLDGLGEAESFVALPVVLSLLLYQAKPGKAANRGAFLSGVLLGLAVSIKVSAVFYVFALPAIELLFREGKLQIVPAARRLSLAAGGFLVMPAVFTVYLIVGGALKDFIDIQRLHVWPYTSLHWSPPGESYLHFFARVSHDYMLANLFLVVPAAGALLIALAGKRRKEITLLTVLAAISLITVWSQGKFFRYHYLVMVFPLALMAGFALDEVISYVSLQRFRGQQIAAYALAGVFLVALTPGVFTESVAQYRYFLGNAIGKTSLADNEARWGEFYRCNHEVVDYIKANGNGDDSTFVWGLWPVIYWWVDEPLVTRFIFDTPLTATWAPETWRKELVNDLETRQPHFIVVARDGAQPYMTGTSGTAEERIQDYPDFKAILSQHYGPVFGNELFEVFAWY
jgi:4-amino-4-deoxy-L-arabinose transferase-like glycosyltransferase